MFYNLYGSLALRAEISVVCLVMVLVQYFFSDQVVSTSFLQLVLNSLAVMSCPVEGSPRKVYVKVRFGRSVGNLAYGQCNTFLRNTSCFLLKLNNEEANGMVRYTLTTTAEIKKKKAQSKLPVPSFQYVQNKNGELKRKRKKKPFERWSRK